MALVLGGRSNNTGMRHHDDWWHFSSAARGGLLERFGTLGAVTGTIRHTFDMPMNTL